MSLDNLSGSSASLDYPEIRPALDLNFARTKALDGRMSFTRSSGGTYVGPDGLIKIAGVNQPRFDHDPVTGESLGLMIEEGRTNILANSIPTAATWQISAGATTTSNSIVSPDGTTTATKFRYSSTNGSSTQLEVNPNSITTATTRIFSIFAKRGELYLFRMGFNDTATGEVITVFNLATGTIHDPSPATVGDFSSISSKIENYGNGWYRCSVMATLAVPGGFKNWFNKMFLVSDPGNNASINGNGDNNSGVYIWGAQTEQGAFATSYIPTAGAAVTRGGESASITGTALTSLYNPIEGTLFCRFRNYGYGNAFHAGAGGVSFENNQFQRNMISLNMRRDGPFYRNGALVVFNTDGVLTDAVTTSGNSNNINDTVNYYNFIGSFSSARRVFTYNGLPPGSNNFQITMPTISRFSISTNTNYFYDSFTGYISRVTYWPRQLPNQMLQTLTK